MDTGNDSITQKAGIHTSVGIGSLDSLTNEKKLNLDSALGGLPDIS